MALTRGRFTRRLLTIVALCGCSIVTLHGQDASDTRSKRVLALHVVRRDSPGFDDTFRSVLREALANRLDYYSEYIDLNRLGDPKYQTALSSYLRSRYVDDGFDLVMKRPGDGRWPSCSIPSPSSGRPTSAGCARWCRPPPI